MYRLIASPLLIILVLTNNSNWFKWLLAFSFFTDLVDGMLARYYKVNSIFGAKLDSIADDLTIVAAIIGLLKFKMAFIMDNYIIVSVLITLFLGQIIIALIRYHKISSFHTYLAKITAIVQGLFLILVFFLKEPPYLLFYSAAVITIVDLAEEIILVFLLPEWKSNVKGIYWVLKNKL